MFMRKLARGVVEITGTVSGLSSMARRVRRDDVAILGYHNIVRPEEAGRGDTSLHMPLPDFVDQIERLARTHRIVDLETALNRTASERPLAVITFDDAYRGAVTLGLPELARRGFPAVVFVSPGLLGADSTWWDELAEAGRLSPETRRSALVDLAGRAEAVRARFLDGRAVPRLPRSYGIATVQELREHCGGNVSLGSHAWGHEHLPSLERTDLEANLARTSEWLAGSGVP
ncbi:MAG: polysaccharide deacetylase family protein, partial [Gemmatimonadota bacterium]